MAMRHIGMMSSVRTRTMYRGTATATYYAPAPELARIAARVVRVCDGRGALIVEIIEDHQGGIHRRFDDYTYWSRVPGLNTLQGCIQANGCRYGVLG